MRVQENTFFTHPKGGGDALCVVVARQHFYQLLATKSLYVTAVTVARQSLTVVLKNECQTTMLQKTRT